MPFPVTADALEARLRGVLNVTALDAATAWDHILPDAARAGNNAVVGGLSARGYSRKQIFAWDRAEEFAADIALFWALVKGGVGRDDPEMPALIAALDRRAELETAAVTVGGESVEPGAGGSAGVIRSGVVERQTGDLFAVPTRRTW